MQTKQGTVIFSNAEAGLILWALNPITEELLVIFQYGEWESNGAYWNATQDQTFLFSELGAETITWLIDSINGGKSISELTLEHICGQYPCEIVKQGPNS